MSVQEVIALFALIAYVVIECLKLGLEWFKLLVTVSDKNAKKITAKSGQLAVIFSQSLRTNRLSVVPFSILIVLLIWRLCKWKFAF